MGRPEQRVRVFRAVVIALLAIVAILLAVGVYWYQGVTSIPSVSRQSEEAAALERHVLPLVEELRVTWYLNERFGRRSMHWNRGPFTTDEAQGREDGERAFDRETTESFQRFSRAIRASGVPTNRLRDAAFAPDGTLRTAAFQRRGGGLEFVLTYIYSPGARPEVWTSPLGPVVLTRIGSSAWWFEQSPDD